MKLTRGQSLVALALLGAGVDALARRRRRRRKEPTARLQFSPDGQQIVLAKETGIWVFDAETKELRWYQFVLETPPTLAFSADSTTLATLHANNVVKTYDLKRGELLQSLPVAEPDQKISAVLALSPNGDRLAVANLDGAVALFHAREGRWLRNFTKGKSGEHVSSGASHKYEVAEVAFSHFNNNLIVLYSGKEWILTTIFGTQSKQVVGIRDIETKPDQLVLSPDGERVAYIQKEGNKKYLSLDDSRSAKTIHEHYLLSSNVNLIFTADGSYLAVLEDYKTLTIYNSANGAEFSRSRVDAASTALTVSPDGKKLAYLVGDQLRVENF